MNIWRMKLRAGNHGPPMLPVCRRRRIAAITYRAIYDTDLTRLTKERLDPGVAGAARSSMFRFAWEIKGGDEILVGDSNTKSIVARGFVRSTPGERAYRFNTRNPIREPLVPHTPWRHEVPVDWDAEFEPIQYRDGAPQITVMHFDPDWIQPSPATGLLPKYPASGDGEEAPPLSEQTYMRETHASKRNVDRLHSALSNRFRRWIAKKFGVRVTQERDSVDVRFKTGQTTHLAELKICYGGNTRAAIREAMGQLLEYNHYPSRSEAGLWWLVLDHSPTKSDREYIDILRNKYALPLTLAWAVESEFEAHPKRPVR